MQETVLYNMQTISQKLLFLVVPLNYFFKLSNVFLVKPWKCCSCERNILKLTNSRWFINIVLADREISEMSLLILWFLLGRVNTPSVFGKHQLRLKPQRQLFWTERHKLDNQVNISWVYGEAEIIFYNDKEIKHTGFSVLNHTYFYTIKHFWDIHNK